MDVIRELGELALGGHMKRLLERMNKDISEVYQLLGIDFEPRWFSMLYLLEGHSPMTVTGIAECLGYTHPAVIKIAAEMSRKGLILSSTDRKDKRKRLLRISGKGREISAFLGPVWEDIRFVVHELLDSVEHNLLSAIEGVEQALDKKELYERLFDRMKPRLLQEIEILEYSPAYKQTFRSLNLKWITKYLKLEKHDEEMLSNPVRTIIKPGGTILFARLGRRIVGTCALVKHEENVFELAKMGVSEDTRRRLVATRLALAIIDRAKELGATALYLETHPSFVPARRLYRSLGFKEVASSPLPARYRRRRIVMELNLGIQTGLMEGG